MLNPIASEALFSAAYVDNYIDSVENLPSDVQRYLSRIRDIDVHYRNYLSDVDHYYDLWCACTSQNGGEYSSQRRQRAITRIQQSLIRAQELGDEKMQIVNQLQEMIDMKTRRLDVDQHNLDIREDLQQQQHHLQQQQQQQQQLVLQQQMDEYAGELPPIKQARTQSPIRAGEQLSLAASMNGVGDGCGGGGSIGNSSGHSGSSNSSDASMLGGERSSGNVSNGTMAGAGAVVSSVTTVANGVNNITLNSATMSGVSAVSGGGDSQRGSGKRSRRRVESMTQGAGSGGGGAGNNMELGGNESNSANEGGSGASGGTLERSASSKSANAGVGQKKNSNPSGAVGGVAAAGGAGVSGGGAAAGGAGTSGSNSGKKKKRKARGTNAATAAQHSNTREDTPPADAIDPDEPTYCVCNQISFGEMILCDNDLCPIEWFHFSCVSLVLKPKGKWFCPNCRGDRPNVMKPKAQFLKELERYNKEKEEKTGERR